MAAPGLEASRCMRAKASRAIESPAMLGAQPASPTPVPHSGSRYRTNSWSCSTGIPIG